MKLLQHFKELTVRPKNAKELKGLILQLAIQGKLTANWREENPNIESAFHILDKIKREKERLLKEKRKRKDKYFPQIKKDEIPFEIPNKWIWCRLQDYLDVRDGTHDTPKYIDKGIPLITSKNLYTKKLDISDVKYISEEDHIEISKRSNVERNDILFAMIGSIGNPVIVDIEPNFSIKNVALIKYYLKNLCLPHFVLFFLEYATKEFKDNSDGAVQSFVSLTKLRAKEFPLPPLEEQKEIVKVVETLFKEVEQLEQLTLERIGLKEDFVTSALNQLTTNNANQEWTFLQEHFKSFFNETTNIKKLRETVLQLAVQGKLTADWRANHPDTEDASILLKRIQKEKAQLIKDKKIKKEKALPKTTKEEIPYEIPEGWVWCRIGTVTDIIAGASFKSGDFNKTGGVKCIKITNAGVRNFVETEDYLPEGFNDLYPNYLIREGDLILALTRPYIKDGLKISICPPTYNNSLLNQRVASIRSMTNSIYHPYIFTFIQSPKVLNYYKSKFDGKSQQPNMKMGDITDLLISIPPLEEQKAIVQKVNALMSLCDRLELEVQQSQEQIAQLMQSCLREVFEGESKTVEI